MNCAAVNITPGSSGYAATPPSKTASVAFNERPEMLVADDGNGCLTPHTTAEVRYPLPGPDVVVGDGVYPLELPYGSCGSVGVQEYQGETGEDGHLEGEVKRMVEA